ncbi:hypothetical protein K2173_012632 [Erythroxylum novogranatense]|uniref:DUF4283 domain-containing protein n=1 Tax=Erythroxylum novogranatense TaxID=1862640 RepID=A0AAV8TLT2_9ROSI|nr:hypothetical protein K2173_012632 [Erythroxylum novogranatense]
MATLDTEGNQPKRGRTQKREDVPTDRPPLSYSATIARLGAGGSSIMLSSTFRAKLDGQWSKAVVVKLLGRRIGFQALNSRLHALWKPSGPLKLIDLEQEFFLVKFLEDSDFMHALTDGPWLIYGQALSVQRWVPAFRPKHGTVDRAATWIHIPDLPIARYHPEILTALENMVGRTVKLDTMTLQAHRGRYARIAMEIDLSFPLRTSVTLDGETLPVFHNFATPVAKWAMRLLFAPNACVPPTSTVQPKAPPMRPSRPIPRPPMQASLLVPPPKLPRLVLAMALGSRYNAVLDPPSNGYNKRLLQQPHARFLQGVPSRPLQRSAPIRSFGRRKRGSDRGGSSRARAGPTGQSFQGLGKSLAHPVSSGVSQARGMGSPLPINGPKQPFRRGSKGKKGPVTPLLRGESSGTKPILTPSPLVIPSVPLQPTSIDKNIAIIIPTHTKMICDQQVLAANEEAVEERLQPMDGVEALGVIDSVSTPPDPTEPSPPNPGVTLPSSDVLPAPGTPEDQAMPPTHEYSILQTPFVAI